MTIDKLWAIDLNDKMTLDDDIFYREVRPADVLSDGQLSFPEDSSAAEKLVKIIDGLPDIPKFFFEEAKKNKEEKAKSRKIIRLRYELLSLSSLLPDFKIDYDSKSYSEKYLRKKKEEYQRFGRDVEFIFASVQKKFQIVQEREDRWNKYDLTSAEILELTAVSSSRKAISATRSKFEMSEEYAQMDRLERRIRSADFERRLSDATTTLWTILSYGANYLSSLERRQISRDAIEADIKARDFLDQKLESLRISELRKYRSDMVNYKLLNSKS